MLSILTVSLKIRDSYFKVQHSVHQLHIAMIHQFKVQHGLKPL